MSLQALSVTQASRLTRSGRSNCRQAAVLIVAAHIQAGDFTRDEMAAFLLAPLGDIALFACLFVGAVLCRHKSETHKRLMLLATVVLMGPAVVRIPVVWLDRCRHCSWSRGCR